MITGNQMAFPMMYQKDDKIYDTIEGLSKRELFSAMALQGLMAVSDKGSMEWDEGVITAAKISVQAADALIKELNENPAVTGLNDITTKTQI